ncbi:MAG: uroporphyrinogen-III C-methyltransferase [Candidatus Abyssobacteria bacterium SURF_17]|uniref:uroporphyrinogen-III C-methyltransferase n=1 Tax=Candidatus Abyssobacteria bacterium SURF_17 TaxID=2093361 RepID=A0A419F1U4_9BACT|nr:MAG: uroporphyrinogen-III C-methyltransferase [Candidatus Abyssubacteria bacterium SURF_17]
MSAHGKLVYLIGAGPGDPGLITLKGTECLKKADVVVYDYLSNPRLLSHCRPDAEKIYVGKKGSQHTLEQEEINQLLVEKASAGKVVARLKGGDSFVFGRGGEEALALAEAGIPFEVVPGITAAVAAPAYAGIPVTHRDLTSTFALVTGHEDPTKEESAIDWAKIATGIGTIAFYMGVKNLPRIVERLIKHGRSPDTPAAVIRWGTMPRQQTVVGTLADIVKKVKQAGLTAPAITIVGEVVKLREQLNWFEARPLFGRKIVVTRSRAQASEFVEQLEALGAEAVEMPTIRIADPEDFGPLDKAIDNIESFHWIVFTSVNAVGRFVEQLLQRGRDIRDLKGIKICAIGAATADEVREYHLRVDLVPPKYVAESVVEALQQAGEIKGSRFLLPRADIARSLLPDEIHRLGGKAVEVDVYRTVLEEEADADVIQRLLEGDLDLVTFTSSSTVRNFAHMLGKERLAQIQSKTGFASIGPVTTQTAKELGIPIHIEASKHDIPGLVEAIKRFFSETSLSHG